MENYYAGYGETWERMALIKARGVAGDSELLYEFNQRLNMINAIIKPGYAALRASHAK